MNRIENPPIGPGSDLETIANLQDVLLFLLFNGRFQVDDELRNELRRERSVSRYGDATNRTVIAFREQYGLEPGEIVDEPTAKALNRALEELGAFENLHSFKCHNWAYAKPALLNVLWQMETAR